jgi:hypothetical protein
MTVSFPASVVPTSASGVQRENPHQKSLHHEPQAWIDGNFLKDGKLRVRERYIREFRPDHVPKTDVTVAVIPDAITWRKYLRMIRALIEDDSLRPPLSWYLLESVAEYMDHRNQSPSVLQVATASCGGEGKVREPYAPQERTVLQRLVQKQDGLLVFCDSSVRQEEDEWEALDYASMTLENRSRLSLLRAGHMIQQGHANDKSSSSTQVWFLCDGGSDPENGLPLAEEEKQDGMKCMDMADLLQWLSENNHVTGEQLDWLMQMRQECQEEYDSRIVAMSNNPAIKDQGSMMYDSEELIQKGLRDGKLFRGRLDITKENPKEAFVTSGTAKLYINGQKRHFDYAIHGDIVIVEALEEAEWGRPVGKRRIVYHSSNDDEPEQLVQDDMAVPPIPSARVIAVDKPGRRTVVATMTDLPASEDTTVLVVPMDSRIPKIRIRTRAWQKFLNVRLKVEIDGWEAGSRFPHGHCVDILGPVGDLEAEVSALLLENEIQLDPFSVEAQACLPVEGEDWVVSEEEAKKRKDLRRSRRVFSVDPPGCQDIDDTMHAEVLPNGDIEGM